MHNPTCPYDIAATWVMICLKNIDSIELGPKNSDSKCRYRCSKPLNDPGKNILFPSLAREKRTYLYINRDSVNSA